MKKQVKTPTDESEVTTKLEQLINSILASGEDESPQQVFSFSSKQVRMLVPNAPVYLLAISAGELLVSASPEMMVAMKAQGMDINPIDTLENFSLDESALWAICHLAEMGK